MNKMASDEIKKILVLGDTGFVGAQLKEYLKKKHPTIETIGISSKDIDLTNPHESQKLSGYFTEDTLVIMTAGIKSNYGNNIETYMKNISMAETVCKALSQKQVKKFIFFSSIAVYGVDKEDTQISENTPVLLDTHYGLSKFDTETLLRLEFSKMKNSELVIIRPPTIYGPNEKIIAPTPSGFFTTYMNGGEVTLWGDGSECREFLFINDLLQMIDLLSFSKFSGTMNLPSGKGHSYSEALEIISKILGKKIKVNNKERTKTKVNKLYDAKLFTKTFPGFKFTTLEEGLKEIMRAQTAKDGADTKPDYYKRTTCRLCKCNRLRLAIPLGESPICGDFIRKDKLGTKQ
jgi:UDP-glucose 4-epimerase